MKPAELRFRLLKQIEQREAEMPRSYVEDTYLAEALSEQLGVIQKQILILEDQELLEVIRTFGPTCSASLTPKGMAVLEATEDEPPPNAIGFLPV